MNKGLRSFRRSRTFDADNAIQRSRARRAAGDLAAAESLLRGVLRAVPDRTDALHELAALTVAKSGYTQQAEDLFRRVVSGDPDKAEYHRNLGIVLMHRGKLMEAEGPLRGALERDPSSADIQFNLGSLLFRQRRFFEAEEVLRAAEMSDPRNAAILYTHGRALAALNSHAQAESCYRGSLRISPGYYDALVSLSQLLHDIGRRDEAEEFALQAVATAPVGQTVSAAVRLAHFHKFRPNDREFERLNQLLSAAKTPEDRGSLLSALAKGYDDTGAFDVAFRHYRDAKAQPGTDQRFNFSAWDAIIDKTREAYTSPSEFATGDWNGQPHIFVTGLSRSGKSLLESLLGAYPSVFAAGEVNYWDAAVQVVLARHKIRSRFPATVDRIGEDLLREVREVYLDNIAALIPENRCIVETSPRNLLYVGLLFKTLPGARVILCERDPFDLCLHMYFKQYKKPQSYSYTNDLADLGRYYTSYARLVTHWCELFGRRLLRVRYEDIVADPAGTASRVGAFCGLPSADLPQFRFTGDEIGRWRNYESHLGPLIEALDNPPSRAPSAALSEEKLSTKAEF